MPTFKHKLESMAALSVFICGSNNHRLSSIDRFSRSHAPAWECILIDADIQAQTGINGCFIGFYLRFK